MTILRNTQEYIETLSNINPKLQNTTNYIEILSNINPSIINSTQFIEILISIDDYNYGPYFDADIDVDDINNVITIPSSSHKYKDGDKVKYNSGGGTPIGGLIEDNIKIYYTGKRSEHTISLHNTYGQSIADENRINISKGNGNKHSLIVQTIFVCISNVDDSTRIPFNMSPQKLGQICVKANKNIVQKLNGITTNLNSDNDPNNTAEKYNIKLDDTLYYKK